MCEVTRRWHLARWLFGLGLSVPLMACGVGGDAETASAQDCSALGALPVVPSDALVVTRFGAVPDDGLADDDGIEAALKALKPDQWLVFPPGHYIHTRSILVGQPGVVLWGFGSTLHATNPADMTVGLRADRSAIYGFTLTAETISRGSKAQEARISVYRDINVPGRLVGNVIRRNVISSGEGKASANSSTSAGILVSRATGFTVAENTVKRTLADGIHVTGGSSNGRILNNVVRETGDDMISVVSYLGRGWERRFKSDADWRAEVQAWSFASSNILIRGNDVADQYWGRGISVVGGRNITLHENRISNTTMAAGILIAQEGGYATFGVRDVEVRDNTITSVQTRSPTYVPESELFASFRDRLRGTKTGHGAIEVHAVQNAPATTVDPELTSLIEVQRISISGNQISDVAGDAIRIGSGTPFGLISRVKLKGNDARGVRGKGLNFNASFGRASCVENTVEGAPVGDSRCAATSSDVVVVGAVLDCRAFP